MNKKRVGFLLIAFLLAAAGIVRAGDDLGLEEIAKTDAAKYYISKQFKQALEAFTQLEQEHPQNVIIKRYIASLYDTLREFDQAIGKLKEVILIKEDDFIARQLLSEIYIKVADFKNAEEQLTWIVDKDPSGPYGKYAAEKLKTIQNLSTQSTESSKKMPVQEFMKSAPAQFFAKGKFQDALKGFDELQTTYPEDVTIRRFRGIILTRLDQNDEAIQTFRDALKIEPDNVALRFYLAQALVKKGKTEEARNQYRWVMEHDDGGYKLRAQQGMFQSLTRDAKAAAQKKWSLGVSQAYDFDTNAVFKSSDPAYTTAGDQNSGKYSTLFTGTYRLYQKKKWTVTGDALYAQSIYHDFPNLNTYTPGVGVSVLYGAFNILGKPAYLNVRDGVTETFLKNKYYVWSNTLSASLIYIPHKRDRITIAHRWSLNEYESNGLTPENTTRDGHSNVPSILNVWYLNEAKTAFLTTGYDFERNDTGGFDYIKNGHVGRLGLHFPLPWKVEGDLSYVFRDGNYIKYASATPKRRDDINTFTATISRPLNSFLTLSFAYTFEDSRGKNNAYEYSRNVIGTKLGAKF